MRDKAAIRRDQRRRKLAKPINQLEQEALRGFRDDMRAGRLPSSGCCTAKIIRHGACSACGMTREEWEETACQSEFERRLGG